MIGPSPTIVDIEKEHESTRELIPVGGSMLCTVHIPGAGIGRSAGLAGSIRD